MNYEFLFNITFIFIVNLKYERDFIKIIDFIIFKWIGNKLSS